MFFHRKNPSVPVIKITYHTDTLCIGGPYSKANAADSAHSALMRAKKPVCFPVIACRKFFVLLCR